LGLGWSAQSEGILSHTGRKARIGTRNRLAYSFVDHLRSTFDFGRHLAVEIAAPRSETLATYVCVFTFNKIFITPDFCAKAIAAEASDSGNVHVISGRGSTLPDFSNAMALSNGPQREPMTFNSLTT